MSEQRIRDALREIAGSVPVRPDPSAAMVTNSPGTRKSWLVPVMAAAAVVLILAVGLVSWPGGGQQPAAGGEPTLPDRFPAFSFVQGETGGKFGRAIAAYFNGSGHEDFTFGQLILASAEGDRYREIEVPEVDSGLVDTRLSASGTKLVIGGTSMALVDLLTGARREYPGAAGRYVKPLAISPDERLVAYTVAESRGSQGILALLDLSTGQRTQVGTKDVSVAAFSPDGTEIAFDEGYPDRDELLIARLDGTIARRIVTPPRSSLAGANSWSPDGKWLVVISREPDRYEGQSIWAGDPSYVFLDAAGKAGQGPAPVPAKGIVPGAWGDAVLGWRSPTSMLVSGGDVDGTTSNLIVEVNVLTGSRAIVSRFAVGQRDDLAVGDVQLAAGLLDGMSIRHSTSPDRGIWPAWAIVSTLVCLAPFVVAVILWWRKRSRAVSR